MKIQKKKFFLRGRGGFRSGWGGGGRCERRSEVFVKILKKNGTVGSGGSGWGSGWM